MPEPPSRTDERNTAFRGHQRRSAPGRGPGGCALYEAKGRPEWRYHGRLVARQLDDAHLVIRADFDYRDSILRQFPGIFSVPARYLNHMMVVADLGNGDASPIEDALEAAWLLQRSAD